LRGDCELIKMTDFIDPFDHEHSSSGVVLLRRETRWHRSSGAQHSLRHSATGRQRAIAKLEESLGTKLFQRRPFALSPTGTELFEFIRPFFENIDVVAERLRQNSSPQLRIAAPAIVLHDYLPQILRRVRAKFPAFRLYLHEATRTDAERLLLARDVDLAIMLIDKKSRAGIQVRPLLELPLILLVHKKSKLTRAEELWKRDKIEETLVCFSRSDPVHAYFQRGLERLGVEWFCGIEVTSERLIQHYVASGYGIGLTVAVPGFKPPPQLRALPLSDFPPVVVGVAWSGKLPDIARQLLAELNVEAEKQRVRIGKSGSRSAASSFSRVRP
jgi:DNA-binding transcriptional LysR family regulator